MIHLDERTEALTNLSLCVHFRADEKVKIVLLDLDNANPDPRPDCGRHSQQEKLPEA